MVSVVFFLIFAIITLLYQKAILTDHNIIMQTHFVFAFFILKKILILIMLFD